MKDISYENPEKSESTEEYRDSRASALERKYKEPASRRAHAFSLNDVETRAMLNFSLYDSKTGRNPIIDG